MQYVVRTTEWKEKNDFYYFWWIHATRERESQSERKIRVWYDIKSWPIVYSLGSVYFVTASFWWTTPGRTESQTAGHSWSRFLASWKEWLLWWTSNQKRGQMKKSSKTSYKRCGSMCWYQLNTNILFLLSFHKV